MNLKEIYKYLGVVSGNSYLNMSREEILVNLDLDIQDQGKIIFRKPIIEMIGDFYSKYGTEIINIINKSGNPFMIPKKEYIGNIIQEISYLTQSFFDECWQDGSMIDFIEDTNIAPPFYGLSSYLNLETGIIDGIESIINILYVYQHHNQHNSQRDYIEGTRNITSELSGMHMTVFIMMSSVLKSPKDTNNQIIEKNASQNGDGGKIYFPERFIMINDKLTLSEDIYNHPILSGEEIIKQHQYMSNIKLRCPAMKSKNKEGNTITFILHQLFSEHFQKYHETQH